MPRYVILQYYTCHRREGIANVSRMCRTLRALCKYILHGAKYQKQCMISTPARASPIRRILHRMFRKSFFPSRLPGEQLVKNEGYLGGHRCRAGRIRTEEKKQSALDRTYRTFALRSRLCVFSTHQMGLIHGWKRREDHRTIQEQLLLRFSKYPLIVIEQNSRSEKTVCTQWCSLMVSPSLQSAASSFFHRDEGLVVSGNMHVETRDDSQLRWSFTHWHPTTRHFSIFVSLLSLSGHRRWFTDNCSCRVWPHW
jgi:hypothetical protein